MRVVVPPRRVEALARLGRRVQAGHRARASAGRAAEMLRLVDRRRHVLRVQLERPEHLEPLREVHVARLAHARVLEAHRPLGMLEGPGLRHHALRHGSRGVGGTKGTLAAGGEGADARRAGGAGRGGGRAVGGAAPPRLAVAVLALVLVDCPDFGPATLRVPNQGGTSAVLDGEQLLVGPTTSELDVNLGVCYRTSSL